MPTGRIPTRALLTVLGFLVLNSGPNSYGAAQEPALAALRLAHLSPDAPLVDVLVDGQLLLKDVGFESVSGYLFVAAGRHEIQVFPHRAAAAADAATDPATPEQAPADPAAGSGDAPSPATPLPRVAPLEPFVISVDLAAGGYYTLGMPGFFDPPAAQTRGGSLSVEVEPGTAVRVTGPRSFAVDLRQSQTLDRLEPGRYTVTAARDGFQTATLQLRINPGETTTLPIDLQRSDGGAPATDTPATGTPATVAPAAQATGAPVWHRTQLQLYEDALTIPPAGRVFLRVVHAAPGVNAVDVVSRNDTGADGAGTDDVRAPVLSDLSFPDASPYLGLAAGRQTLEVRLAGTDFVLATVRDTRLVPGALYTLYLVGTLNDQFLTPLPTVDAVVRGPFGP